MRVTRLILAGLLLLMALGQVVSFADFTAALQTYRVGIPVTPLAVAVVLAEVAGGAGLLAADRSWARHVGALLTLGVAVFWSLMAVQAFARGLVIPNCGCFGRYASQQLRWWVLLEDLSFTASAAWVLLVSRRDRRDRPNERFGHHHRVST